MAEQYLAALDNYLKESDKYSEYTAKFSTTASKAPLNKARRAFDDIQYKMEEEITLPEAYTERIRNYAFNDPGVLAAEMGYDAINARGHGDSESYTVILNRTKLIIKEGGADGYKQG